VGGVFPEFPGDYDIDRKHDFAAPFARQLHDLARGRGEIWLAQGFADGITLGIEKRVRHAAADDQHVRFADEIEEQLDLGRDLGAADDGDLRTRRIGERGGEVSQFLFHRPSRRCGKRMRKSLGRGMRAMCGGKGVIDKNVAIRRQRPDEIGIVLFLALVKSRVFEKRDIAVLHRVRDRRRLGADAIISEEDLSPEKFFELFRDRPQRVFFLALAARTAEMREQDHLPALPR